MTGNLIWLHDGTTLSNYVIVDKIHLICIKVSLEHQFELKHSICDHLAGDFSPAIEMDGTRHSRNAVF